MTYAAILQKHLSIPKKHLPSSNNKILIPSESILRFVTSLSRNIGELCIPRTYETTSDTHVSTYVEVCSPQTRKRGMRNGRIMRHIARFKSALSNIVGYSERKSGVYKSKGNCFWLTDWLRVALCYEGKYPSILKGWKIQFDPKYSSKVNRKHIKNLIQSELSILTDYGLLLSYELVIIFSCKKL